MEQKYPERMIQAHMRAEHRVGRLRGEIIENSQCYQARLETNGEAVSRLTETMRLNRKESLQTHLKGEFFIEHLISTR